MESDIQMRFISHYSSSKHNLYTVETVSGGRLMIECGCTPKQLQKKLDYRLDNIVGCLTSHEHLDHARSAEWLLNNGIDVYMSMGTAQALSLAHRRLHILRDRHLSHISQYEVFPFSVEHDAAEPLGFIVKEGAEALLFITDTFMVKQRFACEFNIIAISCNYDGSTLKQRVDEGKVNETYAKRLLTSHMEKETTKAYLRDCCNLGKCTEIHLLHMSENNADKERIRKEIENEFFIETIIA